MPKTFPQPKRSNLSWTPFQRRTWLATQRGKHRRQPAPVLRPLFPDLLQWDWLLPNPFQWHVWQSTDGGLTYFLIEDYWAAGDARQFAPDGGSEWYFIVGVDAAGNEITGRSSAVRPDDAVAPTAVLSGSLLTDLWAYYPLDIYDLGSTPDVSGQGRHLTATLDAGLTVEGNSVRGYSLKNVDANYLETAGVAFPLTGNFSVALWFYPDPANNNAGYFTFINLNGEDNYEYITVSTALDAGGDGLYRFRLWAMGGEQFGGGNYDYLVPAEFFFQWHHVVLSHASGGTWSVYLDGLPIDPNSPAPLPAMTFTVNGPVRLGGGYAGLPALGNVDEVGLWTRILTGAEVGELYHAGAGLAYPVT